MGYDSIASPPLFGLIFIEKFIDMLSDGFWVALEMRDCGHTAARFLMALVGESKYLCWVEAER